MWRSAVQLRAGLLVEKYETAVETRVFRFFYDFGGIAQLVEHNICNVGVAGSNPTISTFSASVFMAEAVFLLLFGKSFLIFESLTINNTYESAW